MGELMPRNSLLDIPLKSLHGGFPNTTSAPPKGTVHAAGSHDSACQSFPRRCRLASQLATPKPFPISRLPTSLSPAWTTPNAKPPANPRQTDSDTSQMGQPNINVVPRFPYLPVPPVA